MKLNQVVALETSIKAQAYSAVSELYKLAQKPDLFQGFTKAYHKREEDGEDLPPERKALQRTVPALLEEVRDHLADMWSIIARKEWSNCTAYADLVVNGQVIVPQVPVSYLLFLEKQLTDVRTFVSHLPTLDVGEQWDYDANTATFRTAPVQTHRTKKVQRPLVLYPATPEHPAQTQLITEDVLAGYWSTVKQSGAIPVPEKTALLQQVERLLRAVKEARQAANNQEEAPTPVVAEALLRFLFSGSSRNA